MIKKILFFIPFLTSVFYSKAQNGQVIREDWTNFEINSSLVQIDSSIGNIWQIGIPQKTFFGISHSVPYAIMTDTINSYPINNHSTFTVSMEDTTSQWGGFPNAYIAFWHKYESDALKDGGYVEFSADSGATWINVVNAYDIGAYPVDEINFYDQADTILGNIPAFSGTNNSWQYSYISLQWVIPVIQPNPNPNVNRNIYFTKKVMFRFNFKSDNINTFKAGWIIDNIAIGFSDLGGGTNSIDPMNFEAHLFPNPMDDRSIIQILSKANDKEYKLSLYNSLGQLVSTKEINNSLQFIIERNDLNSGIYFYVITNKQGQNNSGKLIIK